MHTIILDPPFSNNFENNSASSSLILSASILLADCRISFSSSKPPGQKGKLVELPLRPSSFAPGALVKDNEFLAVSPNELTSTSSYPTRRPVAGSLFTCTHLNTNINKKVICLVEWEFIFTDITL